MAVFIDLEDSPMFHKQVCLLEQETDELKDRCQRLYKGCKSFLTALGEACNGDITFADSMEAFGGGEDDPVSLSVGGPILSKFVTAFRELATYKELLRSQVEHVLVDRVMQFMSADLQGAKDSRRRFDKSINTYDQAREKFASLKKSTREDVVAELEEDLHNSKSAFEKSRFNLVNALMNIEAKKKYEFLESFSTIMDAHLRYFKLGYDLLSQMEPLIHQVLTYAQQSKESAQADQDKLARRMQEFRTETERDNFQAASNLEASAKVDGWRPAGVNSYKDIQAMMRSGTNGEVRTIKQGYLLKRSSNLRGDWKRRFFVLDSYGALYYYRTKGPKAGAFSTHQYTASPEHGNGVFSRFRTRHNRSSSWSEENLGCHTVDLHTSTIKTDAEDTDLRLCFRIISPSKSYTLQAESDADRMDWVNKITGVITSLLNSHLFKQEPNIGANEKVNISFIGQALPDVLSLQNSGCLGDDLEEDTQDVSRILREIPGNDHCAECGSAEPDWASLNLGVLLCIECSGVHRNLGVHISKVRSLTLDVKVWEPTILDLFRALGNAYCNSVWEELLPSNNERSNECYGSSIAIVKPCPDESFRKKEEYIQLKYAEKLLINKKGPESGYIFCATSLWGAVRDNNLREAYRLIVTSDANILNATFDEIDGSGPYADKQAANQESHPLDPASCVKIKEGEPENCLRGCSLLHVASHGGNVVMLELLLQFGADINVRDFHGRTPLHHCIAKRNNGMAKYLLRRGAHRLIKDWGGMTALERAMEMGAITDEELFILLAENQ